MAVTARSLSLSFARGGKRRARAVPPAQQNEGGAATGPWRTSRWKEREYAARIRLRWHRRAGAPCHTRPAPPGSSQQATGPRLRAQGGGHRPTVPIRSRGHHGLSLPPSSVRTNPSAAPSPVALAASLPTDLLHRPPATHPGTRCGSSPRCGLDPQAPPPRAGVALQKPRLRPSPLRPLTPHALCHPRDARTPLATTARHRPPEATPIGSGLCGD